MNRTIPRKSWLSIALAAVLASCALPVSTPTPFVFPTPNQAQTLTAVFQVPPTSTSIPQPTVAGNTPAGAATNTPASGTAAATVSPTPANCTNKAEYVSETYPDYTYVAPGTSFTKSWTLKNAGTCTWGPGYSLAFDSGNQMGGPSTVPLTATTAPNATVTLSVNLVAPATLGSYQSMWKLLNPQAGKIDIVVKNAAGADTNNTDLFWALISTTVVTPGPVVPACAAKSERPSANGPMIEAYRVTTAPIIDGDLSDWPATLSWNAHYDVFGSVGELDGRFHMKWDSNYLYLAVRVEDDNYVQETSGGSNLYLGDSLEILMDTDLKGDYCNNFLDGDDFQLGISGGFLVGPGDGPTAYLWFPTTKKGLKVVDIAALQVAGPAGYIIEARIPWNVFGILPAGSEKYGFSFSVSDNDDSGTTKQQGMVSSGPKRKLTDPTTWQTLQIEVEAGP